MVFGTSLSSSPNVKDLLPYSIEDEPLFLEYRKNEAPTIIKTITVMTNRFLGFPSALPLPILVTA